MRERSDSVFVADILDEAQKIGEFISGMESEEFAKDELVRHAVERSLEIIGRRRKACRKITGKSILTWNGRR
jgi:uncharacterized protein with HEPN domain